MVMRVSFFQLAYADLEHDVSFGRTSFSLGETALMTPWRRAVISSVEVVGILGWTDCACC